MNLLQCSSCIQTKTYSCILPCLCDSLRICAVSPSTYEYPLLEEGLGEGAGRVGGVSDPFLCFVSRTFDIYGGSRGLTQTVMLGAVHVYVYISKGFTLNVWKFCFL